MDSFPDNIGKPTPERQIITESIAVQVTVLWLLRKWGKERALEIFCPTRWHVAPIWFTPPCQISPSSVWCRSEGMLPLQLKIVPIFTTIFQNTNAYKRCIPCTIFTEFPGFVGSFFQLVNNKSWAIQSRGSGVMGIKIEGCSFSKIFSVPHWQS